MSTIETIDLSTTAIHGGLAPDPETGAILTPIYQSTTFVWEAVGKNRGFSYSRSANPTVSAFERQLGVFEDAPPALAFSTGMSALTALFLGLLRSGDHVVCSDVIYGGTVRLLRRVLDRFGVTVTFCDTGEAEAIRAACTDTTRLVLVESPGNPTLRLADISGAASAAHDCGALLAVDNTFLTAVLQRPFELGADIVLYSTTKYIEGHNATVGGAILARDKDVLDRLRFVQNATGIIQSPLHAWLTSQGLKTLPLRIVRHSESAFEIAAWLERHPAVKRVAYPFLESHPQYQLARRQQSGGGGIVSFELSGGVDAGRSLMNAVELCSLAENLGSVETLITHPATMTHASMTAEERAAAGIDDGLVRLSVGLEDPRDIIADLDRALGVEGGAR